MQKSIFKPKLPTGSQGQDGNLPSDDGKPDSIKEDNMETYSIWVNKEVYGFLLDAKRKARGKEPMGDESKERFWNLAIKRKSDGRAELFDGSLNLSIGQIKKMLDDAGWEYEITD